MCGIVGYKGTKRAYPVLKEMLEKLEYRGYDSAGICVSGQNLNVEKNVGTIESLEEITSEETTGIGHTRWATHGKVSIENAHPHLDCKNEIAVAHNGIIENYQELKTELEKNGHFFKSETDSEVLAHLIETYSEEFSLKDAVQKALERVEGTYALIVTKTGEDKLIASRKGSPLVIGIGNKEYFISSDIPSFLEHTKKVIYLYDEDVVEINTKLNIFNQNKKVERKVEQIKWDTSQVKKGDFKHFMLKEICEQADVVKRAIAQDNKKIKKIAEEIRSAKNIFFLACGTSANACRAVSYVFSKGAKMHTPVIIGSEFGNYEQLLDENSIVIAVSQSGETADVLIPLRKAKKRGAKVISIVNVMGSSIQREADEFLLLNALPEIAVASTKAYTAMLSVLYLIAYTTFNDFEGGKKRLKNLYNEIYNLTSLNARKQIKEIAHELKDSNHIYVIGRDSQYATAEEVALKIKEISYIPTEAIPAGELKHGTLALIEKGTPVITIFSEQNQQATLNNVIEIKSRGGKIIGVGHNINNNFDHYVKTPEVGLLNPIVDIIPMQLLAYELSLLRGNNPDRPRNLAKSVTVV